MPRENYERFVTRDHAGLYESQYLKANHPNGSEALWIKHNILRSPDGTTGVGEFWFIHFHREHTPRVYKREVPFSSLVFGDGVSLSAADVRLSREACAGKIADARWQFSLSGGIAPLFHFAWPAFYEMGFPKKKILTPAPNLIFDGEFELGGKITRVEKWIGLRGHNWGKEHAFTYAYGSCNAWDDGALDRAADGFTAKIKIAGLLTPWLSSLVTSAEKHNRARDWLTKTLVEPLRWHIAYDDLSLDMRGDDGQYAGLRYFHPSGRESFCYNTKLARVEMNADGKTFTSQCGEHEVLYPVALPAVPLHPSQGWTQKDGDYRSP